MLHLMPRPNKDELVSSLWVRAAQHMMLPIGVLTRELTGRKWSPGFFQAGHLVQLGVAIGMEPQVLMRGHTVLSYATAYMSAQSRAAVERKALATGLTARSLGAVTQNVSDFVPHRRWCAHCLEYELKSTGETFWHRSHNLPGVLVCDKHATPLWESGLTCRKSSVWQGLMPHQITDGRKLALPDSATPVLLRIARKSVDALRAPASEETLSPMWYRGQIFELGLVSPRREVSSAALKSLIEARTSPQLLVLMGFNANDVRLEWAALMVRPCVGIPFAPLKHILLRTVLETLETSDVCRLDHVPTGLTKRPRDVQDMHYAPIVGAIVDTLLSEGRTARVCDVLEQAGCWHLYRHERDSYPRISNAVIALRTSAASARRTSARRIAKVKSRRRA